MAELHDRLTEMGAQAQWPATPELAEAVRAALVEEGGAAAPGERGGAGAPAQQRRCLRRLPARRGAGRARPRWPLRLVRHPAAVLASALLAVAGATLLIAAPGVRSALLRTLGLEHAKVTRVEKLPPSTLGTRLALGERATLVRAQALAGFALRRPPALGAPDQVYVDRGLVSFVYGAGSGRLVLLQQVRGSAAPFVRKFARDVTRVDVRGVPGLLVSGEHVTVFEQRPGGVRQEPSRLAQTTLVWERNGLLFRLEGDLAEAELLRIASAIA